MMVAQKISKIWCDYSTNAFIKQQPVLRANYIQSSVLKNHVILLIPHPIRLDPHHHLI